MKKALELDNIDTVANTQGTRKRGPRKASTGPTRGVSSAVGLPSTHVTYTDNARTYNACARPYPCTAVPP